MYEMGSLPSDWPADSSVHASEPSLTVGLLPRPITQFDEHRDK